MSDSKRRARRACALGVITALCASGCALVWQRTDTTGEKAAKLAGRVPLALVTLGLSEVVISREVERERQWQIDAQREAQRRNLVEQMQHWQEVAFTAGKGDTERRELALHFFEAARADLAALDAAAGLSPVSARGDSAPK